MSLERFFHQLADDGAPDSSAERLIQHGLSGLSSAYGWGALRNRRRYESGAKIPLRLTAPVIAIGNISLGGTGKTPVTIWMARWLRQQGLRPAILSRGYRRQKENALTVVHDGERLLAGPQEGGDEPVLMARELADVPVLACSERARSGAEAIARYGANVLLLDDGFQHHRLARDLNVVLIDATKPLPRMRVFPRGTLREPLAALSRAHVFLQTRWSDNLSSAQENAAFLSQRHPETPLLACRFDPVEVRWLAADRREPVASALAGRRVIAACGVGHPEGFRRTLESTGAQVVALKACGDHAKYTTEDLAFWEEERLRLAADAVLVTEKDAVKLTGGAAGDLPESLASLSIAMRFATPEMEERLASVVQRALAPYAHPQPERSTPDE
ncbi:MAG: tetraacyldisaccharide 4'-kinase [Sumerlaeia bacterium]